MPFDGVTVAAVCRELNDELYQQRIDKVYQPEKNELVILIRGRRGNCRLLISAHPRWARMHTTETRKENPSRPPTFCMLLRKHLEGGKIKAVEQVGFDRIVHLRIEALNEFMEWQEKVLVCEFMGKHSNIILMEPEKGIIIDAIKRYSHEVSTHREVLPGKLYIPPPSQGKLDPRSMSWKDFTERCWEDPDRVISRALFNACAGLSPFTARELCLQSALSPGLPAGECGELELSRLFQGCSELIQQVTDGEVEPSVRTAGSDVVEFAPYPLALEKAGEEVQTFTSINQATDWYFQDKMAGERLNSLKTNLMRDLRNLLQKAYRRAMFQEGDLVQAEGNEKYQQYGELLTAYAYQLQKGQPVAVLEDFYTGKPVEIKLEPHLTPIENAQRYFRRYEKAKATTRHARARLRNTREEIEYLESVMVAVEQVDTLAEAEEIIEELESQRVFKKKKKSRPSRQPETRSQPRSFTSSDGLEILVGRNNRQNDRLTLKEADRNDLWLHTRQIPGTHVIVRLPAQMTSIDEVPDQTLEEAAMLAAYFSKASQSEKVPVDYTFRYNVRKPKGAKPGMVIYDNHWTIIVNPGDPRVQRLLQSSNP